MGETKARAIVRERSGGMCEMGLPHICLRHAAGVHHRVKRGQGGPWTPSNLLDACGSGTTGCHGWAESHPTLAFEEGISLHRGDDPAAISVHMRWANQRSWWFLDDEGLLHWDESDFEDVVLADGHLTWIFSAKPAR